ncbi:MAG: HlyC/CorC family transporter [Myxococcales bacterium]|nr:HlyC/CorC family transporter [Myxococcales bacterium]
MLTVVNGVFSGAEVALLTVRDTRLAELVGRGSRRARSATALRAHPERFLATVQVGITVIGTAAGTYGGATFAADLAGRFAAVPALAPYARELAFVIAVAVVSFFSVVVGELVPKSLGLRHAERYALTVADPMRALAWLMRPLVWLLTGASNLILRLFGERTAFVEQQRSAEELDQLVGEAARSGVVHPHAGRIMARTFDFAKLTVADVMVPRHEVVMLPRSATAEEVQRAVLDHAYTRMPVYEGSIDNVVGYITVKDILYLVWDQRLFVLEDLLRPPFFVPASKLAIELLEEMKERRAPFAIVVDETGGVAGIVTLEDLLEEFVGELFSEHSRDEPELVRREADGALLALGTTPVRHLNREHGLSLPEDEGWHTVAGLCVTLAGHIPKPGEVVDIPGVATLEVVEASTRRVRSLRIRTPAPAAESERAARARDARPEA